MSDQHYANATATDSKAEETNTLQIGAFSGYNRRPIPTTSGLTSQFYGENGDDADLMSALNLTKFLDAEAYVNVYLIKNALGQVMKENGQYPKVAAFSCKIQRPKPLRDGLMAQFFALNGEDADAINELGKTKYLDAFVYVEILKPEARPNAPGQQGPIMIPAPSNDLDALAHQLTPAERKEVAKRNKAFSAANDALRMSGFLTQPTVWSVLGNEFNYESWLIKVPCCASGESSCTEHSGVFKLPVESHERYSFVSLCDKHAEQARNSLLPGGLPFLRLRQRVLIQQWAWERICELLHVEKGQQPDPVKLLHWAKENKVSQFVPPNYLNKF